MEEDLYHDAPLQAYLALADKYYKEDRLDLAMRVAQDAFAHEGWQPGIWTGFFNELQCEYDARAASDVHQVDEKLSIELARTESEQVSDTLKQATLEARERVRELLGAAFEVQVMITVFLPDAPLVFIFGTYGYVQHKVGLDKICLPYYLLQSPDSMRNALTHEFSHVATHELANRDIPHWLDEGVAKYIEDMPSEAVVRNAASRYPKLLSLARTEGAFGSADLRKDQPAQVTAAYKLAASFIDWWIRQFGLSTLRQSFYYINEGQRVDRAIAHATGRSLHSMERDWRRSLQS